MKNTKKESDSCDFKEVSASCVYKFKISNLKIHFFPHRRNKRIKLLRSMLTLFPDVNLKNYVNAFFSFYK